MILLLGCIGSNTEPRFTAVNGLDVKRIFGIPFLPEPIVVAPGDTVTLDFTVIDRERDDIQLLFPHAPVGFDFPPTGTSGTFSPPSETWDYAELEVIAIDEHGASEVMYIALEIPGAEWAWDTGSPYSGGALLFGEVDVSTGFDGAVGLYVEDETTSCIWLWEATALRSSPTDCTGCDGAWGFTASGGATLDGDCSAVEGATPERAETKLGFAAEYDYEGFPLSNVVLTPIEGYGWVPLGEGTLTEDQFEFYLPLLSEEE